MTRSPRLASRPSPPPQSRSRIPRSSVRTVRMARCRAGTLSISRRCSHLRAASRSAFTSTRRTPPTPRPSWPPAAATRFTFGTWRRTSRCSGSSGTGRTSGDRTWVTSQSHHTLSKLTAVYRVGRRLCLRLPRPPDARLLTTHEQARPRVPPDAVCGQRHGVLRILPLARR